MITLALKDFAKRFTWLYWSKTQSLSLSSQFLIVIFCLFLGYMTSVLTVDSPELGSYLAISYTWFFGIILFADLGGHFNQHAKHLTLWLNFIPGKGIYIFTLWLVFLVTAFIYSVLSVLGSFVIHLSYTGDLPLFSCIAQSIYHQTLALTIMAMFTHALGMWMDSGLRQMIALSVGIIIFFLSSIIPYFFSFNDPTINLIFEILPRLDMYDNRNALYIALVPFPLSYTGWLTLYALGQFLLYGSLTWLKLKLEGWK